MYDLVCLAVDPPDAVAAVLTDAAAAGGATAIEADATLPGSINAGATIARLRFAAADRRAGELGLQFVREIERRLNHAIYGTTGGKVSVGKQQVSQALKTYAALALSAGKGGFTPPVTAPHGRFRPADLSLVDRRVSLITSMLATPA